MTSAFKEFVLSLLPRGVVAQKGTGHHVHLTFDDGPHPKNTPQLIEVLRANGVKATFFVQGQNVVRFPAIARRIVEEGHGIAGHSWSHRRLQQWACREAWDEFNRTRIVIRETTGVETNWYRPPFGWVTLPMLAYAATGRMKLVLGSVDSDDARTRSVAAILAKGRQVRGGDIVLCHDDNEAILEALPALLHEWRARGLDLCALSDDDGV